MPSPVVVDVRARIRAAERPLNAVERALLVATVAAPAEGGEDVVMALREAARQARASARDLGPAERRPLLALVEAVEELMKHSQTDARTEAAAAAVLAGQRGAAAHAAAAPHWSERAERDVELTGAPR